MKQTRFIPTENCGLHIRETESGQNSREIEGKPIVFGVRSVNLTPWSETREVYEVLEPGCISNELLQRSDVILNLNHSNMVPDVLGRCRNGQGTLSLRLADDHVECRCELPRTNNANDALELMQRGDITGMSFAFEDDYEDTENGVSYERTNEIHDGKEVWLRHVKRITGLYDVAIVTHPAYEQTTVAHRELGDTIDAAIDLQLEMEAYQRKQTSQSEEERKLREIEEAKKVKAEEEAKMRELRKRETDIIRQRRMVQVAHIKLENMEIIEY